MNFIKNPNIPGLILIEPQVFGDNRGNFFESYNQKLFANNGINANFVQDNQSFSVQIGTLRGLHFQTGDSAQAKLVNVVAGRVFDVVVDLRPNSPSFGQWVSYELSAENHQMLFVPRGLAHGFMTLTQDVICTYKCDNYYDKSAESGLIWNDSTLKINWPLSVKPVLSQKDKLLPSLTPCKS